MRGGLLLPLLATLCAQQLPSLIREMLPRGGAPVVEKVNRTLAQLEQGNPRRIEASFTTPEVNSYIHEAARMNPQTGFSNPWVTLQPKNTVTVEFDFDPRQFLAWRPQWQRWVQRLPIPRLLEKKHVLVEVHFTTEQQRLQLEVTRARLNGRFVSSTLVNFGLRYLRRWKEGKLNVVDGVPLPWHIHHIVTGENVITIST